MALVKCSECGKEVSDTAKTCPQCGYNLRKKKLKIDFKSDISRFNVLALILLIYAFITSFFDVSFSRDNYSSSRQLLYESFNDTMLVFIGYFDIVFIIIGIISIILLSINVLSKMKLKVLDKIKNNKILCYLPTIVYTTIALIISILVMVGSIDVHTLIYDTYYKLSWGGFWILLLLITSSTLLIIDLTKTIKKMKKL